jgi:hypothetical protein
LAIRAPGHRAAGFEPKRALDAGHQRRALFQRIRWMQWFGIAVASAFLKDPNGCCAYAG